MKRVFILCVLFCLGVFAVHSGLASAQCNIALISDDSYLDDSVLFSILDDLGIDYQVFNNNDSDGIAYTDDPSFLSNWDVIIWYQSGYDDYGRDITQAEHDAMEAWLQNGGRLLVTGYDVMGSPDDPLMADLIRSSSYGDYTDGYYSDVVADHPISNGPYGNYVGDTDIEAADDDNDDAVADTSRGAVAVSLVNYELGDNIAKIMATEDTGTGMKVVFWNGNDYIDDWNDPSSYPELNDLLRNTLVWLCEEIAPATAIPALDQWGMVGFIVLLASVSVVVIRRRFSS